METMNSSPLVLVTGASGFLAKHTVHKLLQENYRVRGTVRNEHEAKIAREAAQHVLRELPNKNDSEKRFSLITADLLSDTKWKEAVAGCQYVIHVASPYPLKAPKNRLALVPVAKGGTLHVLNASIREPTVQKIVMVSSLVAVAGKENPPKPVFNVTEKDWSEPKWTRLGAYPVSKTVAEKAAWDFMKENGQTEKLVVVNPGMIWGPLLDDVGCTSRDICKLIITGAYPAVPPLSYPVADVRDIAAVLVAALKSPNVGGRRLLCAGETLSLKDIGRILAQHFPKYADRVPQRVLPGWLTLLWSKFDPQLSLSASLLGTRVEVDSQYVTDLTGVSFHPSEEAVISTAQSLIDLGILAKDPNASSQRWFLPSRL